MKKHPSDLADRFMVRMPPGLRNKIHAAAKLNCRSANSEIVFHLMEIFGAAEAAKDSDGGASLVASTAVTECETAAHQRGVSITTV